MTGSTFDYGVITFDPTPVVKNYFAFFDIPLVDFAAVLPNGTDIFVDFKTGAIVPDTALPAGNATAALMGYLELMEQYPNISNGFDLPSPVPENLLLTWGELLEKYSLGAMAFETFEYLEGVGNILDQTALYMMKYLSVDTAKSIIGSGSNFVTSARRDNQELYDKALLKLGSAVLLNSNVTQIHRHEEGVETSVCTPSGSQTIRSSKLLMAIPPQPSNLAFLDLTTEEESLFRQFNASYYWDAVIRNSGISDFVSLTNIDLANPYALPSFPGIYTISYTGLPKLQTIYYTSAHFLLDEEVKADILATVARLVSSLGYENGNGTTAMELVGFNNHSPYLMTVDVDAIAGGFYERANRLQGTRRTYWTGAAWQTEDSSQIWNWTEYVLLPQLVAD